MRCTMLHGGRSDIAAAASLVPSSKLRFMAGLRLWEMK